MGIGNDGSESGSDTTAAKDRQGQLLWPVHTRPEANSAAASADKERDEKCDDEEPTSTDGLVYLFADSSDTDDEGNSTTITPAAATKAPAKT
ncbi:hypothetical protein NX059_007598 [Plenodomus lindquistii]|nr:hypothetical protein NX059_007598 [Plenodomus lindquistii]